MELPVTILLEVIAALVHQDILAKTAEKVLTRFGHYILNLSGDTDKNIV